MDVTLIGEWLMVDDAGAAIDWWEWPHAGATGEGSRCAQEDGWKDTSWERATQEDTGFHFSRSTCSRAERKYWAQGVAK